MTAIDDYLNQLNQQMAADSAKPNPYTDVSEVDEDIPEGTTPGQMREQVLLMIQDVLETSVKDGADGPHGIIILTVADNAYRKWAYGLSCAQMVGFLELYKSAVIADWLQ